MGRAVEISLKLEWRDCGAGSIRVQLLVVSHLPVLAGSVGGSEELVAARLHILVDAQGVLKVVTFAGIVRISDYFSEGLR